MRNINTQKIAGALFSLVAAIASPVLAQVEAVGHCRCNAHASLSEAHLRDSSVSKLILPQGLPDTFLVDLPLSGKVLSLRLEKNQVFGENTRFLISDGNGSLTQIEPGVDCTYLGEAVNQPAFTVSALLTEEGLTATILRPGQSSITVTPVAGSVRRHMHEIIMDQTDDRQACQHASEPFDSQGIPKVNSEEVAASTGPVAVGSSQVGTIEASSITSTATLPPSRVMDVLEFEVGVEIGSRAYEGNYGSNLASAQSAAASIANNMDARYLRGAGIKHVIGTVIIRTNSTTDPLRNSVTSGNSGSLAAFRDYWNSNPGEVGTTHDLAVYHVRASPSGIAYVNSVGTSNRYALSCSTGPTSWADGTLTHEFGHSWNLRHVNEGPITEYDYDAGATPPSSYYESKPRDSGGSNSAGGNHVFVSVMHGGSTHNVGRLSSDEANTAYSTRENKRNHGTLVANPGPVPPFGRRDLAATAGGPVTIDVIANDYDSNNDVLDVVLLDTVSHKGGAITLSSGTGPGGRNEVIYTPPSGLVGPDFFHYTVCDPGGLTDWGAVYIENIGPESVDLNAPKYFYDLGTPSSPIFTGNSDPYMRLSHLTFGDYGFVSNGPNPVESRDRGPISGVNDINRDHIRMRSPGAFHHRLSPGIYDVLFTIGDSTETTAPIRFTAEDSAVITTESHAPQTATNYVFRDIPVTDGELNVQIENLGFSANITRIIITRVGIFLDPSQTSFNYDLGPSNSTVQSGWMAVTTDMIGDVTWSGDPVNSGDRGNSSGANSINRDFIYGSGISSFNHKLSNGTWNVVFNMGDADLAHDQMGVRAEGQLISDNINTVAGEFPYVDESGASATPTSFQVVVNDGELNLEFSDNGGSNPDWVINRISLSRVDGDVDGDGYGDLLELAVGTDPGNALSKPELSSNALAGHWPLDETSGEIAVDASGQGYDAAWAGNSGENLWVVGLIGGAAQLNDEDGGSGQEHFRVMDLSSLDSSSSLSLSLWFNQNVDANNNSNYNGLLMTRTLQSTIANGDENWGIAIENNNSPRHIDWRLNNAAYPETDNILGDVVDQWHHVLYVWDGASGTISLYQDGALVTSTSAPTGTILAGGDWRIGDDACCNSREFTGTLDDIAIFGSALNSTDAAMIYNAGMSGYSIDNMIGLGVSPPVVVTGAASNVSQTGADVAYTVSDDGGESPSVTLFYGESDGGTVPGNWASSLALGAQTDGSHTANLSGLSPDTLYYYAIYGANTGGEDWGDTSSFTTPGYSYATWSAANSVIGGPNDDDDGDLIWNLLEYALGIDPKVPDGSPGSFVDNMLTYYKGAEAVTNGDLTYTIETSTNLQGPWNPVTPDVNDSSVISYTLPSGLGRLFARLRVTQN